MARPEEKTQSMLHRYYRSRGGDGGGGVPEKSRARRRPYLATLCEDVDEAEKWKRQVLRDVSRKVSDIQNRKLRRRQRSSWSGCPCLWGVPLTFFISCGGAAAIRDWRATAGLGDERTRELNDEINKLLRERRHWERRIRDLGGKNYAREAASAPVPGVEGAVCHKGYFYFGVARDLPGVAALVESERRGRGADAGDGEFDDTPIEELLRRVDPSKYYGYEDTDLEAAERNKEAEDRKKLILEWEGTEGAATVEDGIPWDASEWEGVLGQPPPSGEALGVALKEVHLEEQKLEAMGLVSQMDTER
jgi:pre-mRNA-splicing factor ISY1